MPLVRFWCGYNTDVLIVSKEKQVQGCFFLMSLSMVKSC